MTPLPDPPKNPRHHQFAVLVSKGSFLVDAYLKVGYQCTRATAYVNGHKLRRRPEVANYIKALMDRVWEEKLAEWDRQREQDLQRLLARLRR